MSCSRSDDDDVNSRCRFRVSGERHRISIVRADRSDSPRAPDRSRTVHARYRPIDFRFRFRSLRCWALFIGQLSRWTTTTARWTCNNAIIAALRPSPRAEPSRATMVVPPRQRRPTTSHSSVTSASAPASTRLTSGWSRPPLACSTVVRSGVPSIYK